MVVTTASAVCWGSTEWADHQWARTIRGGYVVRIYCDRCRAIPIDMFNRPIHRDPSVADPTEHTDHQENE